ncbi:LuxR C-terminal-related transcriptional regulator [Gordonia rhizosphera]|nr:LuxR C-terminal-related transcriptional regulator [Gordonia rhizosphera]
MDPMAAARVRRRDAALARLAARRMPLPGLPSQPVTSPEENRTDPVGHREPIGHREPMGIHLVVADVATHRPPRPSGSIPPPPPVVVPPAARLNRVRPDLTDREVQVLRTWLLTDSKIVVAEELNIAMGTVNTHLTRIRAKYASVNRLARTKAALAARAIQDGILSLDEL